MAKKGGRTILDDMMVAAAFFIVFLIFIMYVYGNTVSSSGLQGIFAFMVENIPFKIGIIEYAVAFMSYFMTFSNDTNAIISSLGSGMEYPLLVDFARLLIATIFYEALFESLKLMMGLSDKDKKCDKIIQRLLCSMICAFFAAVAMNWSMDIFSDQIKQLPQSGQLVVACVIVVIAVAGLCGVLKLVKAKDDFITEFVVKGIMLNAIKLVLIYFTASAVMLALAYGNSAAILSCIAGALLLLIAFEGITLIISSPFR